MDRISLPSSDIKSDYDVLVVGSGYGGGIAASRMARAGQSVALFERGREMIPGEYPDTPIAAAKEMQMNTPDGHIGSRLGMFEFHVNKDMNALVGCGLGGTSLINANVSLRVTDFVWQDTRWPQAIRDDLHTGIEHGYLRAEKMLGANPYPASCPPLKKTEAHKQSAKGLGDGAMFYRPPINVTFSDGTNAAGVEQKACNYCGDCVSGCNNKAKNTTLMNYLPDAVNNGAEIFTCVSVRHITPGETRRWRVWYQPVDAERETFDAAELFVEADFVMLGAGTIGSTEILLRSAEHGLTLSDKLGKNYTGNGDVLGMAYNCDQPINGIGFGDHDPDDIGPVGPCITSIIDHRNTPDLHDAYVIEEGSIPGAIGGILPAGLAAFNAGLGIDTDSGFGDEIKEHSRVLESMIRGPYHGAVNNSQTFLVMCHDNAQGEVLLKDNAPRISWPAVGDQPIFTKVNNVLLDATKPLGGTYLKNPIWSHALGNKLVTVHSLGGAGMAEDAASGVTSHKGEVFAGKTGTDTHAGLYVVDGAIMPMSLGVNPLLTISALAERNMAILASEQGWSIDYDKKPDRVIPTIPHQPGVQFTEKMTGFMAPATPTENTMSYDDAWEAGKDNNTTIQFVLTITSNDVTEMVNNPAHKAVMAGTVTAPALSDKPMTISDGEFQLFVDDTSEVETKNMVYRMTLNSAEGKRWHFSGKKIINPQSLTKVWPQTSTLYVDIADEQQRVISKAILHIKPADFMKQMTTMKAINTDSLTEKTKALATFGRYFAGSLFDTYGGIFQADNYFNPDAPPRTKRQLRVGAPQLHPFTTTDNTDLLLTRYNGGEQHPDGKAKDVVIMVHGAGVSSDIFATDLPPTNLLEAVYAQGYDVWLLDFRCSIKLAASQTSFNGDQIADIDMPEAVNYIRRTTGVASIQAIVHCFGANTFFMAMLKGMAGIKSIVCSQIATDLITPLISRVKTGLHLPTILDALGVDSLDAYTDSHANWQQKLLDDALHLYPVDADEQCDNPVCKRITFMYALLYEHSQLDERIHDHLHELFGVCNMDAFKHLALMVREKKVVTANGQDSYLDGINHLDLPITFIHGQHNQCYLPQSTEKTLARLIERFDQHQYARHVIPGYGHIDCIFGKHAHEDVYPFILQHLNKWA